MGRTGGSSSKRRYSKKKSLKVASEARRKKRSRRNKSKKIRRHDDSFSSYSDDESSSSSLVSSSSSEGEHKSRRARSRTREESKGSRKRTRRRYSSKESSDDSPPVKKRKSSKKKDLSETRKNKKKNKKRSRRDSYSSLAYSDSASCSTCSGGNSSSDEGAEIERPRGRSSEKKKHHRDSSKSRKGRRKNRNRPRSSSPSELSNSFGNDSIEKVVVENNPRRLKSVITVAKHLEEEEVSDMNKDQLKEEIVYDYDDYPSCRSNDSNEGGTRKEVVDYSNVSSEKKRITESVGGEVDSTSTHKDNKSVSPGKNVSKEYVDSKQKETNASGDIGSGGVDLESVLRQKALENLSRFRGGLKTKAVATPDEKQNNDQSTIKQLPTANVNLIQNQGKLPLSSQDCASMIGGSQPVIQKSRFTWKRDPSVATGKEEKAANRVTEPDRSQAPAPKLQSTNLSTTSNLVNKSEYETSKVMANTHNNADNVPTSDAHKSTTALETPTKEGSSKEGQTETQDSSQFEQKTMSVMRGGEMVQVSYKVYIPKKAPALARRQLKR